VNILFVDLLNWLEYAQDETGRLWLADYPGSPRAPAGGGARELRGPSEVLAALGELLQVLARHAPQLHRHAPIAQPHLGAIARLAQALAAGMPLAPATTEARRCFEWTPLPGSWGEAVGVAWARLDSVVDASG
jgi:hypothetical protein